MSNMSFLTQKGSRLASMGLNILPIFSLLLGLVAPVPLAQPGAAAAQSASTVQPAGSPTTQEQKPQNCQQLHECALRFNGQNQWVELHDFRGFDTPALTLETGFNWPGGGSPIPEGYGSLSGGIPFITIGGSGTSSPDTRVRLFFGIQASTGTLKAVFEGAPLAPGLSAQDYSLLGSSQITPDAWHHAAVTYDGQTLRLYLDGNLDGELTYETPVLPQLVSAPDVYLAAALPNEGKGLAFYRGELDEVRIWEVARSQGEIQSAVNLDHLEDPNLIARWSMDEGLDNEVHDSSGEGAHGVSHNGPVWTDGAMLALSTATTINATTTANLAPQVPALISPANGATGAPTSPTLAVSVSDPDSTNLTATFYGRTATLDPRADFTLIVLPDTQKYTFNGLGIFGLQTQWIANQQSAQNIAFVAHMGDVVDSWWSNAMWNVASAAMSNLEPGIAYGIAVGNCDEDNYGVPTQNTTYFNRYFPASRFSGRPYYGGAFNGDNANSYQIFSVSGLDYIVVNLKYNLSYDAAQQQAILAWAHNLLQANPSRRAIVNTHNLLDTNNNFSADGNAIYTALRDMPNLFLMMGGHLDSTAQVPASLRQDTGTDGHTIYSLRSDYQTQPNGGNGWLRVLRFSPETNRIYVTTYSPYLNQYMTDAANQFPLDYNMNGASFQVIGTTSVTSGSTAVMNWPTLQAGTQYDWYVGVNDGTSTTYGSVWNFTTAGGAAAPTVTTQPVNQAVVAGQSASFTAAASGSPTPTVQWQVSTDNGVTWSNIAGATSATYSFTAQATDSGKQYRAIFTNTEGSATTSAATLTVNTPPVVTTQPANQTVNAGQTAGFTAAASGSPAPTVQWQVSTDSGVTWSNISGATSATYTFMAQATDNAKQFRAVFTNAAGTATTNAATLTVNTAPVVTTQPASQTVNAGQTASFAAAASGSPAPTVQWQVSTDSGVTWNNISGATSATYSFTAQATDNARQFRAVFTNAAGTATTNAATLTVNTAPIVTLQPANQTVNPGQSASFAAAATGLPAPTVQWQVSTDSGVTWSNITGATSATYSFTAQETDSGRQYRAVFTNTAGTATTNAATLTVNNAPVVTLQPANQAVNPGQAASFTASATGLPTPTVQWQVSTDTGVTWTNITGATSGTYSFTAQAGDNGKQFRAVFTNSAGTATTNAATLTLNTPPVVTTQPSIQTVVAGQTASFTAAASGSPAPTVQWQVSTNSGVTWSNITGATSATYSFTAQAADNAKQFHAVFTNAAGSATSDAATLTVNTPPVVTAQPSNQTVNAGEAASFSAAASGSPTPTIQWQVSTDNGLSWNNIIGATSGTYSFTAQATDNAKQYQAVFTNAAGTATSNAATLTINTPPVVTTQPSNQTVVAGQSASFTAAASGSPTPTVQWQISTDSGVTWSNVTGATSATYSFTAQATDNDEQYHAVFTNSAGSATTNSATLTVYTPPLVTTQPASQTVNAGQSASFTAAASGSPAPTIQWQVSTDNGLTWSNITGATSTTYSFTAQTTDNGNQYRAAFTNIAGSANSIAAVLTVYFAPAVTSQPMSHTVVAGQVVSFTAAASGSPTPTVQWQVSTDSGVTWSNVTGATSTTYSFTAQATDSGRQYRAVFTNTEGSATTSAATLTVNTPPVVTTQPANQTVVAGQTASFTAAASGSPAPTIQWQVSTDNGLSWSNITGATSTTYSFTAQATDNDEQYHAVFTNSAGSATTNSATLTVYTPPLVTTHPANQTVIAGQSASFTAAASGSPAPTVQWQISTDSGVTWSNIAGAASATYTFTTQATDNGEQFHAVFTNAAGSATTNAALLTVNGDVIFKDGFDTCNADAWTGGTTNASALTFNTASGQNGACGMAVKVANGAAAYVVDPSATGATSFHARFYFNPSTLKMAKNDVITFYYAYHNANQPVISEQVRYTGTTFQVRAGSLSNSRKWIYTGWSTVSNAWHSLEIEWAASTASGVNNGTLTFWVDGVQAASLTTLSTYQETVDQVALGVLAGMDGTTSGTFFLDTYESRHLAYIGP